MIKNKTKSVKAQKCIYQRDNSTICRSYALKGSTYCWRHSPEISEEEKRNHFIRGGKARWQKGENVKLPPVKINDINDIVKLLCDTLNHLRDGSISQKIASSTAYVVMTLILAMKESESENGLKNLKPMVYGLNRLYRQRTTFTKIDSLWTRKAKSTFWKIAHTVD